MNSRETPKDPKMMLLIADRKNFPQSILIQLYLQSHCLLFLYSPAGQRFLEAGSYVKIHRLN